MLPHIPGAQNSVVMSGMFAVFSVAILGKISFHTGIEFDYSSQVLHLVEAPSSAVISRISPSSLPLLVSSTSVLPPLLLPPLLMPPLLPPLLTPPLPPLPPPPPVLQPLLAAAEGAGAPADALLPAAEAAPATGPPDSAVQCSTKYSTPSRRGATHTGAAAGLLGSMMCTCRNN